MFLSSGPEKAHLFVSYRTLYRCIATFLQLECPDAFVSLNHVRVRWLALGCSAHWPRVVFSFKQLAKLEGVCRTRDEVLVPGTFLCAGQKHLKETRQGCYIE
ncbi:hypothetical protein DIPPA_64476 [Diplonema papillatum]|nr:hypothetical protein DIPPA_64475 [Diplonema papillatum]KAJ9438592.1 hypothetical protein DIPPA_64476 [Diplonema papillatum]